MDKWFGKVAVVTGASAGIGAAITEALAHEGVNVVGLARRKERVEKLAEKNKSAKGKIFGVECDITSSESIGEAFDWIERTLGGVDILVNNAGLVKHSRIFDLAIAEENYLVTVHTNLSGLLLVTRRAYKTMQDKPMGYVININSVLGHVSASAEFVAFGSNVYGPTKHAVTQLSAVMRIELTQGKKNIRLTNLSPGVVKTEIDIASKIVYDGVRADWNAMPHLESSDIADQVIHLLSTKPNVIITELTIQPVGEMF